MNTLYSKKEISPVIYLSKGTSKHVQLNYNIEECTAPLYKFTCNYVKIGIRDVSYSKIVSAIINAKYSIDDMTAIQNNYMAYPEDEDYKKNFQEMQEYRLFAKDTAKEFINIINKNKEE